MPAIADHTEAQTAINTYLMQHAANEPEAIRDAIMTAINTPSPVDKYRNVSESIYGRKDEASEAALLLAADLAQFMSNEQFHGFGEGRGSGMSKAMKRVAGVSGNWPAEKNDPEPLSQYVAQPEPEEPAATEDPSGE